MRRTTWLGVMVAIALAACDDERTSPDGGGRDAGLSLGEHDAGDSGTDGGPRDAGPPDTTDAGRTEGGAPDGGERECPPSAAQVVEACPAFIACGGALPAGQRCHDGLCVERSELLAPMLRYCAAIEIEAAAGTVAGRVSLLDGQLARASATALDVRIRFPERCVVNGCDEVETLTRSQLSRFVVTCAMTDACRCELTLRETVERTGPYAADVSAGVLTTGAGEDARVYDYCVSEDGAVHLRDRSGGQAELGMQRLAPPL